MPSRDVIETTLKFQGARPDERGRTVIHFVDQTGRTALGHKADVKGDEMILTIPMKEMPPGDYRVRFELFAKNGKKVWLAEQPFRKWPTPIWLRNRKGIQALEPKWVPAPWTPVEIRDSVVSVWGRQTRIQQGRLIAQIESQEMPLLSGPATIHYSSAGRQHRLNIGKPRLEMSERGRAILTQQGDSEKFTFAVRHTIEFDGMHLLDLILQPKRECKVERLWIDIPFRNAKYLMFTSQQGLRSSSWQSGLFPEDGLSSPVFYKVIWLGNDRVGCCFFVENYKGWVLNSEKPRIVLENEGETRRMRLL
ncbi:MAG: DUF6067 family protein, partial [Planctomycetota bacterium]|nr:DUF6067 family protein [Planctomycetota bacterium]